MTANLIVRPASVFLGRKQSASLAYIVTKIKRRAQARSNEQLPQHGPASGVCIQKNLGHNTPYDTGLNTLGYGSFSNSRARCKGAKSAFKVDIWRPGCSQARTCVETSHFKRSDFLNRTAGALTKPNSRSKTQYRGGLTTKSHQPEVGMPIAQRNYGALCTDHRILFITCFDATA
jgi:hypothetical protein